MAQHHFNVGSANNSHDGEPERDAWVNVEANFNEVFSIAGTALFRNRLRNATFAINQRVVSGTVSLSAGQYGHDGVKAGASGATYTFSASGIDTTITVSAGSIILPIDAGLIEGGNYVLTHAGSAQARVWQTTASGSYATVPAGGLAAAGLTANTLTGVEFSTGTILRPQFEPGAYPTPFERRPLAIERAICRAYFRKSYAIGTAPGAATEVGSVRNGNGTSYSFWLAYERIEQMVGTPTVTFYSIAGTINNVTYFNGTSNLDTTSFVTGPNGNTSSLISASLNSVSGAQAIKYQYTASAEL